jgi:hypothetical protein
LITGEINIQIEGNPGDGDKPSEVKEKVQAIVDDLQENTGLPWEQDGEVEVFTYRGGRFNVSADLIIKEKEEEEGESLSQ